MRDVLEVIERLDAAIEAAVPRSGDRFGDFRERLDEEDAAWDEYWSIMKPLTEQERHLVDPKLPPVAKARAESERRRQVFYAQQTENIRAAWAAREGGDA